MKQHITLKQLDELPLKSKVRLREWCIEQKYCGLKNEIGVLSDMQLSIGQMIEFLSEKWDSKIIISPNTDCGWLVAWDFAKPKDKDKYCMSLELADALWEAVKTKLSEVGE